MTVKMSPNPATLPSPNFAWLGIAGLYAWSVLLILVVVYFPKLNISRVWFATSPKLEDIPHTLSQLDGKFYERVLLYGYANARGYPTLAAFFPGYPVVARLFWECGLSSKWSLLVANWIALGGAFYLLHLYTMRRFPASESMALLVVAALALNPMAFSMRFFYSEATFLCTLLFLFVLMQARVSPWIVAVICGALTGIRPPGIVAVPLVLHYAWTFPAQGTSRWLQRGAAILLCAWGLELYMLALVQSYGDPLQFVHAQEEFQKVSHTLPEKLTSLFTLAPIYRAFSTTSNNFREMNWTWLTSNQVGDAIFWVLFASLILCGSWKRWLNAQEFWISASLFAFCTWFQADRNNMACQGRFVSVIFPAYIVAGHLLTQIPVSLRWAIAGISSYLYVHYAMNFAAGLCW